METPLSIFIVPSDRMVQYNKVLELCSAAYEEDFTDYLNLLNPAVHILAYTHGQLVCHAAWVERRLYLGEFSLRAAYIEAVATLPAQQRKGFASALMQVLPTKLSQFDIAALSPSNPTFYEPLGWELWQGQLSYFDKDKHEIFTPEEQVMIYRLPLTPSKITLTEKLSVDWRPGEVW